MFNRFLKISIFVRHGESHQRRIWSSPTGSPQETGSSSGDCLRYGLHRWPL